MVKCEFPGCTEKLTYLPFKCSYCGKTFCKKHRLPENHNCEFKMSPKQRIPRASTISSSSPSYPEDSEEIIGNSIDVDTSFESQDWEGIESEPQENNEFSRSRYYPSYPSNRSYNRRRTNSFLYQLIHPSPQTPIVTYWIITLTTIFSLLTIIPAITPYLSLNILMLKKGHVYTLFTAAFIVDISFSFFTIIGYIFTIFILWGLARPLEARFGRKFMMHLYFLPALIASVVMIAIQAIGLFSLSTLYLLTGYFLSEQAALYALITFFIYYTGGEREFTFLFFFIPIRLKGKHLLWFLIGFSLFMGIINFLSGSPYFIQNIGNLMGFIVAKYIYQKRGNPSHIYQRFLGV